MARISMADILFGQMTESFNHPMHSSQIRKAGFEIRVHMREADMKKVYEVWHLPTKASVDVPETELMDECDRVGARTTFEKRAVLMRMVGEALKRGEGKLLQPGGQDGKEEER